MAKNDLPVVYEYTETQKGRKVIDGTKELLENEDEFAPGRDIEDVVVPPDFE